MNRNAKLLALFASTGLITGCGPDGKLQVRPVGAEAVLPVDDLLAQGRTDFALNNVALALDQFRRAERLQPTNVSALNGIAACYDRLGRFDLSRIYYEKALALAPADPRTRHNFALSLTMQGRMTEALALARETAPPATPIPVQPAPGASNQTQNGAAIPPPAPAVVPHPAVESASAPAAPAEPSLPGPHLERLSLSEVELVTVQPSKTTSPKERQANAVRSRPAERVVKVAQAKLVKQTRTSSEWVFPQAPAKAVASVTTPPSDRPNRPKVVVVAAAAAPAPAPVEKPAPVAPPAVLAPPQVQLAVVTPSAPPPVAAPKPLVVQAPSPRPAAERSHRARPAGEVQLASAAAGAQAQLAVAIPSAAPPVAAPKPLVVQAPSPRPAAKGSQRARPVSEVQLASAEAGAQAQLAVATPSAPPPVAAPKPVAVQAPSRRPAAKGTQPVHPPRQVQLAAAAAVPPARMPILATATLAAPVAALPPRPTPRPRLLATPVHAERKPKPAVAPRVRVLNAVGRKGLANRYSHYLQSRGWSGLKTADARHPRAITVIFYPAGARAQAAALARRLPFRATLAAGRNRSELLVLLGNDALAFDNRLRLRVSRT